MLKINDIKFQEKFTEINIRHRLYKGKSIITLIITTEFYPSLCNENIVSGVIEAKIDLQNINSLNDLVNKSYQGDIGSVTISVNNNGIWEHDTKDKFEINIKNRNKRKLDFKLKTDNCKLETKGTIVSLYTTSTSKKDLEKKFNLSDFYNNPIIREINNITVYKYFVKD